MGSLLFFIYANNLQYALNFVPHITFGDDTNLFHADENIKIFETVIVELLTIVSVLSPTRYL